MSIQFILCPDSVSAENPKVVLHNVLSYKAQPHLVAFLSYQIKASATSGPLAIMHASGIILGLYRHAKALCMMLAMPGIIGKQIYTIQIIF